MGYHELPGNNDEPLNYEEEGFYIRSGPSSVKLPVSKVLTYLEQRTKQYKLIDKK